MPANSSPQPPSRRSAGSSTYPATAPTINGPPAEPERDGLVASGVTINGLPIINRNPRFGRYELDVDKYYAASVIGGPGAFLIVAEDFSAFSEAIRRKLLQEIS